MLPITPSRLTACGTLPSAAAVPRDRRPHSFSQRGSTMKATASSARSPQSKTSSAVTSDSPLRSVVLSSLTTCHPEFPWACRPTENESKSPWYCHPEHRPLPGQQATPLFDVHHNPFG